ncbi:helix-turn-helix domain-containing protein [Granulicella sibirica]|uniref:helix-turn-helix domain-containing protein n=1 Tax=Granulicella sibirica TaxID=2479048 RepID=UPI00137590B4|nr:helix-turn-helix domain-containing protein [Granulicella sibirica]
MKLVQLVESKNEALRVRDVAPILGVSIQQVYKMAANGQIPSFRIASSIRFDPEDFAEWLRKQYPLRGAVHLNHSSRPA